MNAKLDSGKTDRIALEELRIGLRTKYWEAFNNKLDEFNTYLTRYKEPSEWTKTGQTVDMASFTFPSVSNESLFPSNDFQYQLYIEAGTVNNRRSNPMVQGIRYFFWRFSVEIFRVMCVTGTEFGLCRSTSLYNLSKFAKFLLLYFVFEA